MTQAVKENQPVLFVLSIDTEEEWDWSGPFPQQHCEVQNVTHVPEFHDTLTKLGIRPTYFVDYAALSTEQSTSYLKKVLEQGNCEMGAHLHPWCNPPYFGDVGEKESHVVNLPIEQVEQKLRGLMEKIQDSLGVEAKSFRSGRWGIDGKVLNQLVKHGIKVDSSVYPFYQNDFFSCHGAPAIPYWPNLTDPLQTSSQRDIFELPVTVGFNRNNFELANSIHTLFSRNKLSWTRFNGFAWHTKLLRKNYLSPELSSIADMQDLCDVAISKGYPVLHMYMHSSSLLNNTNSLIGQDNAFNHICHAITQVVNFLKQKYPIEVCTISEAANKLQQQNMATTNDL